MKNVTRCTKYLMLVVGLISFAFNVSAETILSETFASSLGSFTPQSLKGDTTWFWSTYKTDAFAKMTGFKSGVNYENDDWLVSPAMDLTNVTKANLSFQHAHRYAATPESDLTLMVTDSYTDGPIDSTKWVAIPFTHSDQASFTFISSGLLALDAYAGKPNVHFAFRYKSSTTASATWEVKNVLVESVTENTPKTVLAEDFSKFVYSTSDAVHGGIDYSLKDSLNTYMGVTGWTGSKIYSAEGTVKLGSSSAQGYLTTPSLDLSSNSGNFSVTLDSRAWSGDATSFNILVNDVVVKVVDGLSNAASPYLLTTYGPFALTGGTATTKITFQAKQASKARFFLDNIKITQGGTVAASATLTAATFSVEKGSTLSKNLTLKGTGVSGDLTVTLTNKSGSAFSTSVQTVTAAQANNEQGFSIPVTYTPTVAGNDTATVSISGGGLAKAVSATVIGTAWVATTVADLAALRTAFNANTSDKTTVYRVSGEVFASFIQSSGNSKYIQDATGGALIYDPSGVIATVVSKGDGMKNVTGTLSNYSGVMEFIPVADVTVSSTGKTIAPIVVTIPEYKANIDKYESMLIQINNLTNISGKTAWATTKANYNFVNGTDTIVIRTNYTGLDYMVSTSTIPVSAVNYAGVALEYSGTAQLCPRDLTDINITTDLDNTSKQLAVYGANGLLNVVADKGQVIEVYNLIGCKLLRAVANQGTNTYHVGTQQVLLVKVGKTVSKVVL